MAGTVETQGELRWYMGGVASYFFGSGIQTVLFPWLLTFYLHQPASRVGIAQMLAMLPMLVLGLFGGAKADRAELRAHLMRLQLANALVPATLAGLFFTDLLTYEALIACTFLGSAIGAFTMPARDSLLTKVAARSLAGRIQQAVTMATGMQFLSQVVGLVAGGAAVVLGAAPLMIFHAVTLLLAAFTTYKLPPAPVTHSHQDKPPVSRMAQIREGFDVVWRSESIRPVVLLMFLSGILYIGVFMVLFPILIRDVYAGSSLELAFINICFFGGIGVSSMVQSRLRPIRRQGRAIMCAMCMGSITMVFLHFHPPLWAVFMLVLGWGLSAGVSMSQSRAIVQMGATDSHRARVLSVFQLGSMGGGPIGALMIGFVITKLGPLNAVLVPSSCMVVLWLSIFFFTKLWRVEVSHGSASGQAGKTA
ncbi:MAG: MFS transporter [Parvibaculaceae bacterium]|nr:MFS transporter [Parvibaculaceae bacterium]